ncbi:unnamed protein product [Periconia digitata]|uniref:Carrier domain-containing protein n=1 Tax=Periconia digitata TaxID=1303443 RepID=A0A9W4UPL3_9PLEO|nr:unnamed protein product [Periconia digitata]
MRVSDTFSSKHPARANGVDPIQTTIVDLFDYWAHKTPDRTAAEWEGKRLTYSELRTASLHVSQALLNAGVAHRDQVPLLTRMSLEMLPAIIGILRVGACYAPIDVAVWGVSRIEYALDALSSSVAVATTWCPEVQLPIVTVNFQRSWFHASLKENETLEKQLSDRRSALQNNDLVWIFFTSGTTGKPKGVMIPHSAAYAYSLVQYMDQNTEDVEFRNLLAFSVSFDGCASVMWATITQGRTLVMASASSFPDVSVTCDALMLTPSMLEILDPLGPYERVRYIFLGAEDPSREVVRQWITPARKVFTTYGPSETTCIITLGRIDPDTEISLGELLPGFKVVLVDENMEESDRGEMMIAGPGVGLGYLNNTELTNRKFIQWKGDRFYRTGDLARKNTSGQFVWAGRADSLVKNRGFLINLETEVEATMLSFPSVQKAVALKWRDRLIGYVQPTTVDTTALRDFMKTRVDPFVIPDDIIKRDKFPLNVNGKIDKVALEAQREEKWQSEQAHSESVLAAGSNMNGVEPRSNGVENSHILNALRGTFSKCLHVGQAQLNEESSFTSLGGNSFSAIRASQSLKRFGYEVSPVQILRLDTIGELERIVREAPSSEPRLETNVLSTNDSERIPATPVQVVHLRRSIETPEAAALIGTARWIADARKTPTPSELHKAFIKALSAHDVFSTRFHLEDMTFSRLDRLNFDWREVSVRDSEFEEACIAAEQQTRRDMYPLSTSDIEVPFYRVTCISVPDRKALAYVTGIHHVLVDVIAQTVLARDIDLALAGESIPQGPSMKEFARYMNQYKQRKLEDAIRMVESMVQPLATTAVLQLPQPNESQGTREVGGEQNSSDQGFDSTYLRLNAPDVIIRKADLDAAAARLRCTPSTLVYAAWSLFLRSISTPDCQDAVGFRISLSGRTVSWDKVDSVVGCLTDSGPFATRVPKDHTDLTIYDWIAQVHKSTLNLFELDGLYQALPKSLLSDPHTNTTNVLCFLNMDPPSTPHWSYAETQKHVYHISWYAFQDGDNVATQFEIQRQRVDADWAVSIASVPTRLLQRLVNADEGCLLADFFN